MSLPNTHFGAEHIGSLLSGKKKIFFAGIGGISMCSLAHISKNRGHTVSGYDRTPSKLTRELEAEGVTVYYEESAGHVEGADLLVYTVAMPADNSEYARAAELGIPCVSRADYLGYLMSGYKNRIGVSGMHGKSTTTSMLERIFTESGKNPTVSCGAVMTDVNSAYVVGGDEYFIFEACEYKDSFLDFYPTTALILNIEMDHVDYFNSLEQIETSFGYFAQRCGRDGIAVVNADDGNVMRAVKNFSGKTVTFSKKNPEADYFADRISFDRGCASFSVVHGGSVIAEVQLAIPGAHLVDDALGAFAAAHENGVAAADIARALGVYRGVARRMEKCGSTPAGADVYLDYAHHPTEIAATLATAQTMEYDRVFCVFQPHTYSRTAALFDSFAGALAKGECAQVVLADIYAARETDTLGVSSSILCDSVKKLGAEAVYIPDFGDMADYLLAKCEKGDMIILMGAGDIASAAKLLV